MDDRNENEILISARENHAESMDYLIMKYKGLVCRIARSYYLTGGDTDDLIQEGTIGLLKAIREYRPDKSVSFKLFAAYCIKNKVKDALRSSARDKHKILNEALAADDLAPEDTPKSADPYADYINREASDVFYGKLSEILSKNQLNVLKMYMDGYSYNEIADTLDINKKSVDNYLASAKEKIKRNFKEL